MVAVEVFKPDVASLEVVLVDAIGVEQIEAGCRSILGGGKDATGTIAVEQVGCLTYLCADGGTVDAVVLIGCIVGQLRDLVLVVTGAGTELPLPVLQSQHLDIGRHIEAFVLQLTAVRPVLVETAEEAQLLHGQQVVGVRTEVIEAQGQAVVDEARLQTDIQPMGGLPLDGGVADAFEGQS